MKSQNSLDCSGIKPQKLWVQKEINIQKLLITDQVKNKEPTVNHEENSPKTITSDGLKPPTPLVRDDSNSEHYWVNKISTLKNHLLTKKLNLKNHRLMNILNLENHWLTTFENVSLMVIILIWLGQILLLEKLWCPSVKWLLDLLVQFLSRLYYSAWLCSKSTTELSKNWTLFWYLQL